MSKKNIGIGIGFLMGLGLGLIQMQTIGVTAAIAIPSFLVGIVNSSVALVLWDVFIVHFLGTGVPTILAAYLAVKFIPYGKYWPILGLILGAASITLFIPALLNNHFQTLFSPYVTHHLYEIVLLVCSLLVAYVLHKRKSA